MASGEEHQQVLLSVEAEALIASLDNFSIKDIGSPKWQKHHEYIEKLNMQALLSATNGEEEFIKETLISLDKVSTLIADLLGIEVWKQNVFSVILQTNYQPQSSIPLYMVLFHEATLVNLLETVLFHQESLQSADDSTLDLLDYCYRKLSATLGKRTQPDESSSKDDAEVDTLKELEKQQEKMDFEIAIKVVSILRYLTDAIDCLPISMASRMMNTHNLPCLLVELIENPPWSKREKGKTKKFIDGSWKEMNGPDVMQLTKIEGQVWLSIYNLIMNPECLKKYDFNSFNKSQVVKLSSYMNEVLLDQLPMLVDMRRYLEQLSVSDPAPPKPDLVLEQLPEIRERLLAENKGKWKGIAKLQMKNYFDPSTDQIRQQAQRLADTYNFEVMDSLLTEIPKCSMCGNEAAKRCSRCRVEWYCRRECQVKHWPVHKEVCNVMSGKNLGTDVKSS